MERIMITSSIVGVTLTEEEVNKVLAEREAKAKREEAELVLEDIKELLRVIHHLGYKVKIEEIGGQYVSRHEPWVTCEAVHLTKW